ncbi:HIT family protein [Candidatus Woesearchaeota archaeon]|nr:HIT family protein [Candidatus Woesearchaeota archaeon]
MSCAICDIAQGRGNVKVVYYDEICIAYLKQMPASAGHIILIPKKHYTIFEQVPDFEVSHLFKIASKLSTVAFETFGHGGTNIIVQNGEAAGQTHPHFSIEIVPRNENDGLNFLWQPKQLSEEEMSTAELMLKEEAANIGGFGIERREEKVKEGKAETLKEEKGKESYLLKSLRRVP